MSSTILRVVSKFTHVSVENNASNFRVEKKAEQFFVSYLFGSHFDPEDGSGAFLRTLCEHLQYYMISGPEDLTCVQDVPCSNPDRATSYHNVVFRAIPESL
jgi:hypothetical protein